MKVLRFVLLAAAVLFFNARVIAQPFAIDWYTVDGGGAMNTTGGIFTLSGTIGQPDAGTMSGGAFTLSGGFWYPGAAPGTPCDPDFNCDGNADQDDVACLIDVVAGNPGCECQDPDFNQDGNVDQDDVAAMINVIAGGPCP